MFEVFVFYARTQYKYLQTVLNKSLRGKGVFMKKILIFIILIITNVFLFAQNIFKDFICKNPFLDDLEVYVDKPDILRGRIFKTVSEEDDFLKKMMIE